MTCWHCSKMNPAHKEVLRKFQVRIVQELKFDVMIEAELLARKVFSEAMIENIKVKI